MFFRNRSLSKFFFHLKYRDIFHCSHLNHLWFVQIDLHVIHITKMNILYRKLIFVLRKIQRSLSLQSFATILIVLYVMAYCKWKWYRENIFILIKVPTFLSLQSSAQILIGFPGKIHLKWIFNTKNALRFYFDLEIFFSAIPRCNVL